MTTILLVEDAHDLAQIILRELEANGYSVLHAIDGLTALQLCSTEHPALVVLDWMLPKLDGLEVLRRLRRTSPTPVLMLTARGEETDRVVVALGAGLLIVLLELLLIHSFSSFALIVAATVGLVGLSLIAMLIVIPPSALFSYLVVRRTTHRLKTLATATSILRGGNYTIRVPVVGEDEVAQLQSDFNVMATDLERAVRELQGERDRVAGLLQSRRELIANVSHELRTPMAALRSYLETTLTHWDDSPQPTLHHDLQIMESEVIRLQALVEDLFALSQAEVGKLTLRCEPTDDD